MDVDSGSVMCPLGHDARKKRNPQTVKRVGQPVDSDGESAGITENDLVLVDRRGIAFVGVEDRRGVLLIDRFGFTMAKYKLSQNQSCPRCGLDIPIIGEYVKSTSIRSF